MSKDRVDWDMGAANRAIDSGSEDGLRDAGEDLRERADALAPVQSGRLVGSAAVAVEGSEAVIGYDTVYAVRLHEHPEYHFRNGGGKWLERAQNEGHSGLLVRLAEGMKRHI